LNEADGADVDLRAEIVEAQKAKLDLFKWKLILVAGLGAAASGLVGNHTASHPNFLFALIPLVCIYVDLLCRDQTLRIVVIARYLHLVHLAHDNALSETAYETFVNKAVKMQVGTPRKSIGEATTRLCKALEGTSTASAYAFQALAQVLIDGVSFSGCYCVGCRIGCWWSGRMGTNCKWGDRLDSRSFILSGVRQTL
jgi:hypothetical protein